MCGADALQEWFAAMKVADADVTRYAVGMTLQRLAKVGVPPHKELAGASDWAGFAFYLSRTLGPFLDSGPNAERLRPLIADLVEFSLLNVSGDPANRLAEWLAQFLRYGSDYERQDRLIALLPAKAKPALEIIERWKEDDRRRADESGY